MQTSEWIRGNFPSVLLISSRFWFLWLRRFREWIIGQQKVSFSAKEFWNWKYFPKLFVCIKLRDLNVFLFTLLLWASAADHVTLTELFQISTAEENRKWLGLSYIRAVRLRHITAARAQDSVTTRLLWLLDSMISFPSVACFQMIWDERLCDILSQDRKLGDHKYSHNDSVVTLRMIKFILMMMIILILMETSTTNRLMETFSSDTKKPSIILRSSAAYTRYFL